MFANDYHTCFNSSASVRFTKLAIWVGLAVLFLHLTSTAAFSQGIIKTLDFPGAVYTAPEDINDSGEVVGYQDNDVNGYGHGFFYKDGKFTPFDVQDSIGTQIRGINNHCDSVGFYMDAQSQSHGFLRDHSGQVTTLDFYGVNQTLPTGINDYGTIVGVYIDDYQVWHYFVYAQGHAVQFDIPNSSIGNGSWPKINKDGSIVGTVFDNDTGEARAVLVSNGASMLFNVNGNGSSGRAINSAGAIAGFYAGGQSGYVLRNGTITLIRVPGALDTHPLGINDQRQLTGAYDDANGSHGFIMQVP